MIERAEIRIPSSRFRFYRYCGIPKISLAVLFLLFSIVSSVTPAENRSPYAYHMSLIHDIPQLLPGQSVVIPVKIKNTSGQKWFYTSEKPINLSYHFLNAKGEMVINDGIRTPVPQGFREGILKARVKAPQETGDYFLEFDLVHEHVTWFALRGASSLRLPVRITEPASLLQDRRSIRKEMATAWWCDIPEINQIQPFVKATLESNAVTFIGLSGPTSGFTAGSSYPHLWIRDLATIIPMAKYYYGREYLRSWIDEHLYFQDKGGGVYDWIDSRGLCDKNTVESDQESSLVIAAFVYYLVTGDNTWLQSNIRKLESALTHILESRKDLKTGLIWSGYTADWGDVSPVYGDQRAVYYDPNTPKVIGLYTNALFCRAAQDLAALFKGLGNTARWKHWQKIAEEWKAKVNTLFWSGNFYRMHCGIWSTSGDRERLKTSQSIFPMGSNSEAILSGIPDMAQVRSIYSEAKQRQQEYGISTIAGVLLPPFPRSFFKHPYMKEPFSYQNGGQWDWFAGRLVLGLFQYGLVREATSELIDISRKVIRNRGFFEWDTQDGVGKGSPHYAGGAAVIGEAIVEGLFGVGAMQDAYTLNIRLGNHEGGIKVFQPSTKSSLYYHYRPSEDRIFLLLYTGTPKKITDLRIWKTEGPWKDLFINNKKTQFSKKVENGQWYYSILDVGF